MKQILKMPLNIPNILTVCRILLVPVFVWQFLSANSSREFFAAAAILLISGVTDVLDGIIARSTGCITQWGMVMDPLADKLTQVSVVVCLWIRHPDLWPFFALLILKELALILGSLRFYKKYELVNGSQWFGKLSTVIFHVLMLVIIAKGELTSQQLLPALWIILIFMLFSAAMYLRRYLTALKENASLKD